MRKRADTGLAARYDSATSRSITGNGKVRILGPGEYLSIPFGVQELLARVRAALLALGRPELANIDRRAVEIQPHRESHGRPSTHILDVLLVKEQPPTQ